MAKKAANAQLEEQSGPSSKDLLGSILESSKDEHFAFVKPKHEIISTGSLILDSLVKVRSGSVVRLTGKGSELGKTSEALVILDNFLKAMPKSKGLFVKAESRLGEEMMARSGIKFVDNAEDWNYGTVFVLPCNIFERFASTVVTLLKDMHEKGEHLGIVLDSMDGLKLRADGQKDMWNGKEAPKVAGVPLLTKMLFRELALPINYYDALLLVTGQYSADIKLDPYGPANHRQVQSAGGNAIAHQADYVFEFEPRRHGKSGDDILENQKEHPDMFTNKVLGVHATLTIRKSGTDVTGTKVRYPLRKGRVGSAIWVEREIGDMMMGWQWAKKENAGSWLYFTEAITKEVKDAIGFELPEKINGPANLYAFLEEHPDLVKYLFGKCRALIQS